MALTAGQRRIAEKIDTRMRKLIRAGGDNMAIMAAMADHMPAFHQQLSTARPGDIERLILELPGFYRYAKILESLATGIQSGAIPVPGRKEAPRETKTVTDHRQRAAAMDLRMGQLTEEGMPRSPIIDRITAYVVNLGETGRVRVATATAPPACQPTCPNHSPVPGCISKVSMAPY